MEQMEMICVDSDFLVAVLRGDNSVIKRVSELDQSGKISTTSINAFEILFGAKKSQRKENIEEARKLLSKLEILNFDLKSSEKASDIFATLLLKGKEVDLKDVFIGAIAFVNGCKLLTRNTEHFSRIEGLEIERW